MWIKVFYLVYLTILVLYCLVITRILLWLTKDRPLLAHASTRVSQTFICKSDSVSYGVAAPFSWVWVHTRLCLCSPRVSVSPVLWKFWNQVPLTFKVRFPGDSQSLCQSSRLESLLWGVELLQQWETLPKLRSWQLIPSLHGKKTGKNGKSDRFIFSGSKITVDSDCNHEIKRCLHLGRKAMTNLNSVLKSRDMTLPAKVHLVKAMVLPVVIYGYESWTIKNAECQRIDASELWCWRKLLRVP